MNMFKGKAPIPPSVWTPLVSFHTDALLEGFGVVWGSRAMAGLFPLELDDLDIGKKVMVTVIWPGIKLKFMWINKLVWPF